MEFSGEQRASLRIDDVLDVLDTENKWVLAVILNANPPAHTNSKVHVHYMGWDPKWNEWILRSSPRLAPPRTHTDGLDTSEEGEKRRKLAELEQQQQQSILSASPPSSSSSSSSSRSSPSSPSPSPHSSSSSPSPPSFPSKASEVGGSIDECDYCTEAYAQDRVPRILFCGHTLCQVCLDKWSHSLSLSERKESQQIKCPECRRSFTVPGEGFPINYAILRLVESRSRASVPASSASKPSISGAALCANCEFQPATLFCQNSCGDLCRACSRTLHRSRALQSHVICPIEDKPTPKLQRKCPEHKDQEALLYCKDCQRLVCVLCGFGSHRPHQVLSVVEFAAEKRDLLRKHLQFVQPNIAKLRTRLAEIDEEQKRSEKDRQTVADAIVISVDTLRQALLQRQQQLQDSLDALVLIQSRNLERLQSQCNTSLDSLVKLEQVLDSLSEMDDVVVVEGCDAWLSVEEKSLIRSESEIKSLIKQDDLVLDMEHPIRNRDVEPEPMF